VRNTAVQKSSAVLLKAAALIQRTGLCKFHLAVDKSRHPVDEMSRQAVAYCALGALCRVDEGMRSRAWNFLTREVGNIPDWNNATRRTKRDVIAKMRAVARLAKAEGD
jgi:hypothetical protein